MGDNNNWLLCTNIEYLPTNYLFEPKVTDYNYNAENELIIDSPPSNVPTVMMEVFLGRRSTCKSTLICNSLTQGVFLFF